MSEPKYLLLLAAVCAAFYVLPKGRPRAVALLVASYMFYVNLSGLYALVLFFVTATSYFGARFIAARKEHERRGRLFAVCCAIVLAPLIILKYSGFLLSIVMINHNAAPLLVGLVLPIGLSFFTFVALGYVIDVHLGVVEPEKRPVEFALFLAFFPLVTAGPIERPGSFLPQFDFHASFQRERALAALRLIFAGMFLKVFLANSLVPSIDAVLNTPIRGDLVPEERVCALIYYMAYIYADFAGYSLIAIGSAKLFGLEVRANFAQPYLSTGIPDFWRRWHISLSSWVRDYLFTPMRMSWRHSPNAGFAAALMLSFLIIGIWHGAGWTFVLFGLMHGTFALTSTYTAKVRDRAWAFLRAPPSLVQAWRILFTDFLVLLTLVLYRAGTLDKAWPLYHDMFRLRFPYEVYYSFAQLIKFGEYTDMHVITMTSWTWLVVAAIFISQVLERRKLTLDRLPPILQIVAYNVGGALIAYGWIANSAAAPFLYYRF